MVSSVCERLLSNVSLSPLRSAVRCSGRASNPSMTIVASRRRELYSAYKSLSVNGKTSLDFSARAFSSWKDDLDIDLDTTIYVEEKIGNAQGTLSVVAINHEGELLVGTSTKQFEGSQIQTEMEIVPCKIVKAPNGDAWVEANGQKYSPFQIGAFLLAQMDEYAQEYCKRTIWNFTVMVPACFRDAQVEVTFDYDYHNGDIILAKDEASEKEMELGFLIDNRSHFSVDNFEKWLNKYREKIPAEIAKEIEKAMALYRRSQREYCEHSLFKCWDKLEGARDALSKIGQHMPKGSSSGESDLDTTNSMEGKIENAQETLSMVGINHKGELLVGTSTKRFEGSQTQMEVAPCKIVEAPNDDAWVEANGQKYSRGQIGAFVVSKLKEFAEAHLGITVTKAFFSIRGCLSDGPVKVSFSISPDDGIGGGFGVGKNAVEIAAAECKIYKKKKRTLL
ncbi:PREDICTED: heat shock 70 kDa protein 9, mitochondrial-like isoform X2 [Tarenaya hassleriana]|uniref:heat shock 70 kDa protein 9, mitochondrial-like isoform X2 n=1 Tax=Tarenaya hassleriana TaxID=28532 RepID=UPI00053C7DE9|nr:PREDICTED: heat shock 70 kDa protein 9, mitochondrial-like isoform X2 [Tarenaya hassleriana]